MYSRGNTNTEIQNINKLRNKLLHTHDQIEVEDFGADPGTKERLISALAAKASVPHTYGLVLHRLVRYFKPSLIIELGTCLGLGTAYMASASPSAYVITLEGSEALARIATNNFKELKINNIDIVTGPFDEQLPRVLERIGRVDMAFIDGNHRYEPTMRYYHLLMERSGADTILVFDDIYWSTEMTRAWEDIKKDPRITLTIDLYRFGIAFMRQEKLAKEDFILRY